MLSEFKFSEKNLANFGLLSNEIDHIVIEKLTFLKLNRNYDAKSNYLVWISTTTATITAPLLKFT